MSSAHSTLSSPQSERLRERGQSASSTTNQQRSGEGRGEAGKEARLQAGERNIQAGGVPL